MVHPRRPFGLLSAVQVGIFVLLGKGPYFVTGSFIISFQCRGFVECAECGLGRLHYRSAYSNARNDFRFLYLFGIGEGTVLFLFERRPYCFVFGFCNL